MSRHSIHNKYRGGKVGELADAYKPSKRSANPIPRIRANDHNPPGHEWIYEGARVQLRGSSAYASTINNPKRHTDYETTGTVTQVDYADGGDPEHRPVHVTWDNDGHNTYFFNDMYKVKVLRKKVKTEEKRGKLFNRNDVVLLKPGYYPVGSENPAMGCKFQCSGMILEAHHRTTEVGLRIRWNNGMTNSYTVQYTAEKDPKISSLVNIDDKDALKELVKTNPNLAYKITKPDQEDDYGILSILRGAAGIKSPDPIGDFIASKGDQYFVSIDLGETVEDWPNDSDDEDGDEPNNEDEGDHRYVPARRSWKNR